MNLNINNMEILKKLIEAVQKTLFNKMLIIGFVICFAIFSEHILKSDNLIDHFKVILEAVIANKTLLLGFGICFAMFSKYILGPDNLIEQLGEKTIHDTFGIDIDFSPEPNVVVVNSQPNTNQINPELNISEAKNG